MDADGIDLDRAITRLYGCVPAGARLVKLRGDASTRSYYRYSLEDAASAPAGLPRALVVMRLPEDVLASDEVSGRERPAELPFVDVQRLLAGRGVRVPRIWVDDAAHRVLLIEDLGDETFDARLTRSPRPLWPELYARAVDVLADMHRACVPPGDPASSVAFRRRFDLPLLRSELDHFREWGLEALHGALSAHDRAALDAVFDALAASVAALPLGFVHRDYQSRNLMLPPDGSLCVLDFQDAFLGPYCYDLVALLCDSYVALDRDLQDAMLRRYCDRMGSATAPLVELERAFWLVAVQRKLKDAGRFVFIDRVRGNPDFLRWYPQSLVYVGRALTALGGLDGLDALLARLVPGFPEAAAIPAAVG